MLPYPICARCAPDEWQENRVVHAQGDRRAHSAGDRRTTNPLRGAPTAQLGERTLTLVLHNGAWCEIEEVLDLSYMDVLAKLATGEIAGRAPKNSMMRAILWGATRAHHPEMSLTECGDALMRDPELHGPLSEAILRSTRS